jgi:hypothetical protein
VAAHGQKATANEHQQLQGMGQDTPALPTDNAVADDDSKVTGALQLLPCRRQCIVAVGVLQGGSEIAL